MFTINLPSFPAPCSHKTLAEAVVGQMDREQCLVVLRAGVAERDLDLIVRERLGYLEDGY